MYESPIETQAGGAHFASSLNYFGHTRIEDMADNETRRVIEVQSDLYQKDQTDSNVVIPPEAREVRSLEALRSLAQIGLDQGKTEQEVFEAMQQSRPRDFIGINSLYEVDQRIKFLNKEYEKEINQANKIIKSVNQYTNPTAHFRMVREEIKRAAKDGITKLEFPTGITALKIEGHWDKYSGSHGFEKIDNQKSDNLGYEPSTTLEEKDIKTGTIIKDSRRYLWIIVNNKGNGEFVAMPYGKNFLKEAKEFYEGMDGELDGMTDYEIGQRWAEEIDGHYEDGGEMGETFSIKTSDEYKKNPLYKFYESDLGKYLKNTFNAKPVTDPQGQTWFEVEVKPEMAGRVEAFQEKDVYDRMGALLLKIKGEAARTMKKETLIERIGAEIEEDLKGGFYTPQIIRQELAKAAKLYEENPELAINIAKGVEQGPDNINYLALGRYALYQVTQQGRAEDQIDIINNISKEARKAGQSISMLRGALTVDSPNQFINQLQSFKNDLARKNFKALFTRSKSVVVEDLIEDEVRKTKRKKSTKDLKEKLLKEKEFELDSFLNALAC